MVTIEHLYHAYWGRREAAIKNFSLHIQKGERLVVIGSSGSGKTTLFKAINRTIEPTAGRILINGEDILRATNARVRELRGSIGVIFQSFNLIERETVIKNVLDGRLRYVTSLNTLLGRFSRIDYETAQENLRLVGLAGYETQRVAHLSGGQKQRVIIARVLSQNPDIILADEPVSSLDHKLTNEIMDLLWQICEKKNITLVANLHFLDLVKRYSSRVVGIKNGELVFDGNVASLTEKDIIDIYGEMKE